MSRWNADDAVALRAYLGRNPQFLRELRGMIPAITGGTLEETALNAMRHKGAEDLITAIETVLFTSPSASVKEPSFINPNDQ